jgi:hypothetical protein
MNEVYLVTRGRYSDYSVHGVFADKSLAEEYAQQISNSYNTAKVETRPIITNLIVPVGHRAYDLIMDIDGNASDIENEEVYDDLLDRSQPELDFVTERYEIPSHYIQTGRYRFYVVTDKGQEGAIKIANERRVRMIAENTWPEKGDVVQDL